MTIRTKETTVTFDHPFSLTALEGQQPAGVYRVVEDEEEIRDLSFLAFQRTATMLHVPASPVLQWALQVRLSLSIRQNSLLPWKQIGKHDSAASRFSTMP
jgi:hypothetical protein